MPNYIKNRLEIIGNENEVKEVLTRFSTFYPEKQHTTHDGDLTYKDSEGEPGWLNEKTNVFIRRSTDNVKGVPAGFEKYMKDEWTQFPDFDKIIKIPESLNITSGSYGDMGYSIINGQSENQFMDISEQLRRFYEFSIDQRIDILEAGMQYAKNMAQHGYKTWYEWCIAKWGTKWNSSECKKINESTFDFITAWSGVPELIEKISIEFPNVKFLYEYSDEDTGCNCGKGIYSDGFTDFKKLENSSIEAYDLAFKLRPDYKENYQLVDGNYEYIEED